MIERNNKKVLNRVYFFIELLILLVVFCFCTSLLLVRFGGDKEVVRVGDIQRNGFRSSYSIAKVVFEGREREVFFCKNNIEVGTEIEVYNSKMFDTMIYGGFSNISIIFYFMGAMISVVCISSLFMKDD